MVPLGGIILWSGAVVDIPGGYQLCDGTNGTPDLKNKFIAGAGDSYNPGATGGAVNHDHTFSAGTHDHANGGTVQAQGAGVAAAWAGILRSGFATVNGITSSNSGLPPYYALAYIQRMV